MRTKTTLVAILALATPALAQPALAPSPLAIGDLLVPVHRPAADPQGAGAPGLWAAGPGDKASCHDCCAFYPVLGKSYPRNLPLCWRTESVTAAGQALVTPGHLPDVTSSAWRVVLDHGAVVEAYDVRK